MIELRLITRHYGHTTARRSGIPYMNHILEGLTILAHLGASDDARRAWCLHPLLQSDEAFERLMRTEAFEGCSPRAMVLTMEYRARANAWLSDKVSIGFAGEILCNGQPSYGPLTEVRHMLIADKVQNYKDFLLYQSDHPRYRELNEYFINWLNVLEIAPARFRQLQDLITS